MAKPEWMYREWAGLKDFRSKGDEIGIFINSQSVDADQKVVETDSSNQQVENAKYMQENKVQIQS
ncbi:hypothetical protein [Paenibacillus sinopodophylli]|uniref:hypothetical protein n=1 Tax=Paenibacillus sinopodophylli TaxID=1837342 RepID=UPI00110D10B4|nr:hypothetical protein [Paenibacillus sinopodophylli]